MTLELAIVTDPGNFLIELSEVNGGRERNDGAPWRKLLSARDDEREREIDHQAGAKLVRPEAEVWIIWGDGSSAYSLAEFDTFTRHRIPVIGLIGNDACWSQIAREQVAILRMTPPLCSPSRITIASPEAMAEGA